MFYTTGHGISYLAICLRQYLLAPLVHYTKWHWNSFCNPVGPFEAAVWPDVGG